MSDREFLEFAPERKAELIGGEVIMASPASRAHERLFAFLFVLLNAYVWRHDLGHVFGSRTAVRLGIPGEVYEPDICFVRRERSGLITPTYIDGPPDLAVEILSRSTAHDDRTVKKATYEHAGVSEYWVIHPERPLAEFYNLAGASYTLAPVDEEGVYRSAAVPGFWLRQTWLWPESGDPNPLPALQELGVF
jgi:Uma2 family endonuclease